jgi:hypothetical protein
MPDDARAELAARQAALVAALTAGAAPPAGFDTRRLRAAAASLAVKRRRAVARAWPGLAGVLDERFTAFTASTPLPRDGGPLADGRAFVRWLGGAAPAACRLQALAVDLRYARTAGGLVARRGPVLKVVVLPEPRRLVLALRLPGLGERWLTIPLGRRSTH